MCELITHLLPAILVRIHPAVTQQEVSVEVLKMSLEVLLLLQVVR